MEILIYTDGACFGNPGRGGFAAVLIYGEKIKEISGGYRKTTNNRMEITAVIKALEAIKSNKKYKIKVITDSKLIVNAFNQGWLDKWSSNSWMRNNKDRVLNSDLWKQLLTLTAKHDVNFEWIEGHAGHEYNERCDVLSKNAAEKDSFNIDLVYESEKGEQLF